MGGDCHYTAMYCKLDSLLAGTSGLAEGSLWRLFESTPTGDLIVVGKDRQSKLTLFEASLRSKFTTNDTKNHTGAW